MQRQYLLVSLLLAVLPLNSTVAGARSTGPLVVQLDSSGLSADVDGQPVARVVAAINRLVPKGCALAGYVFAAPEAKVSVTFKSQPLRVGLGRLLKGNNYSLNCDSNRGRGVNLTLVGADHAQQREPDTDPAAEPTVTETAPALTTESTDDAASAVLVARLYELQELGVVEELLVELEMAVDQPDTYVKQEALVLLAQIDDPHAVQLMQRVAYSEADPDLRARALDMFALRSDLDPAALAEAAAAEHDPMAAEPESGFAIDGDL